MWGDVVTFKAPCPTCRGHDVSFRRRNKTTAPGLVSIVVNDDKTQTKVTGPIRDVLVVFGWCLTPGCGKWRQEQTETERCDGAS